MTTDVMIHIRISPHKDSPQRQTKDKELTPTGHHECAFIHWGNNNLLGNSGT